VSQMPGSFRPNELAGSDRQPSDAELAGAWTAARELEAALPPDPIGPSASFADRVMAAVAREPAPRPAGFLDALRARPGLSGLSASVREAWAVAFTGVARPARVRGMALAYVFAVVVIGSSLAGTVALGAAGALGLLDPDPSPAPSTIVSPTTGPSPSASPSPSPSMPGASGSPGPTATGEPTGTAEPSESVEPGESDAPDASDDGASSPPGATVAPSPEESDDHGGGGSSPSPNDDESPEPSDTPRPSDTPKPSETPH